MRTVGVIVAGGGGWNFAGGADAVRAVVALFFIVFAIAVGFVVLAWLWSRRRRDGSG